MYLLHKELPKGAGSDDTGIHCVVMVGSIFDPSHYSFYMYISQPSRNGLHGCEIKLGSWGGKDWE